MSQPTQFGVIPVSPQSGVPTAFPNPASQPNLGRTLDEAVSNLYQAVRSFDFSSLPEDIRKALVKKIEAETEKTNAEARWLEAQAARMENDNDIILRSSNERIEDYRANRIGAMIARSKSEIATHQASETKASLEKLKAEKELKEVLSGKPSYSPRPTQNRPSNRYPNNRGPNPVQSTKPVQQEKAPFNKQLADQIAPIVEQQAAESQKT